MGSAILVPSATHPTIVQAPVSGPRGSRRGPAPPPALAHLWASRWALPSWTQTHQVILMSFSYSAL